jgi:anti-sigma B factor antagonist
MNFTHEKHDRYSILKVNEKNLDALKATDLKSELAILNTEGIRNIILDLSDVEFIDSSGLGAMLIGDRVCKAVHGTFVVSNSNKQVIQLVKISQLHNILNIIPTNKEAMDFILLEEFERDLKGN